MRLIPGFAACVCTALIVSSVALAQGGLPRGVVQSGPLVSFTDEAALDSFARRMARQSREYAREMSYNVPAPMAAPPEYAAEAVAADAADAVVEYLDGPPAAESITNTQVAGVDEGGIVKTAGDYLVVLRRGRLFTIRTGGDRLAPADSIDAFPPGTQNPGDAWYDEMLVHGDTVIVIGYSYGDAGTEINRFRIAQDGSLTYRDTHYLSSGDYYSDENYASRLLGDRLVFYAPLPIYWSEWRRSLPELRRRQSGGRLGEAVQLAKPENIFIGADQFARGIAPEILHTVTSCDLTAPQLTCTAQAVAGSWSRVFFVSSTAAYVWTQDFQPDYDSDDKPISAKLVRLPLDGSAPGAVDVSGGPINQFSFAEDAADGVLRVVVRGEGRGDAMWASRFSRGETGLLTIPLASFQTGQVAANALRKLPGVEGERFENRFVGRHLLYSATLYDDAAIRHRLMVVPFDGEVTQIELPHQAARLDVLGRDAVAVGSDARGALGFTAVSLTGTPQIESTFRLPGASEGESRSQAFFYRPDPGSDGDAGTLGLPVSRQRGHSSSAAILFLRRDARLLAEAGELAARTDPPADDRCIASCVDWYGNARPIFLGQRMFALMGYELVEGTLASGRISERRRVDFSPAS